MEGRERGERRESSEVARVASRDGVRETVGRRRTKKTKKTKTWRNEPASFVRGVLALVVARARGGFRAHAARVARGRDSSPFDRPVREKNATACSPLMVTGADEGATLRLPTHSVASRQYASTRPEVRPAAYPLRRARRAASRSLRRRAASDSTMWPEFSSIARYTVSMATRGGKQAARGCFGARGKNDSTSALEKKRFGLPVFDFDACASSVFSVDSVSLLRARPRRGPRRGRRGDSTPDGRWIHHRLRHECASPPRWSSPQQGDAAQLRTVPCPVAPREVGVLADQLAVLVPVSGCGQAPARTAARSVIGTRTSVARVLAAGLRLERSARRVRVCHRSSIHGVSRVPAPARRARCRDVRAVLRGVVRIVRARGVEGDGERGTRGSREEKKQKRPRVGSNREGITWRTTRGCADADARTEKARPKTFAVRRVVRQRVRRVSHDVRLGDGGGSGLYRTGWVHVRRCAGEAA